MKGDLEQLLAHVGLGDIPLSELGGNYPGKDSAQAARDKKARDRDAQIYQRRPSAWRANQIARGEPAELPLAYQPSNNCLAEENPIDIAFDLQTEMWRTGHNVTDMAHEIGRSRAYVRNHLRLLKLPLEIQDHVSQGRLSEGHARAIAKMRDPKAMARLIIKRQISVRGAETIARRLRYIGPDGLLSRETAIPQTHYAEGMIEAALGCKARLKDRAGRGKFEIHYKNPAQAQEILDRLCRDYSLGAIQQM
ncbi:MAG: hypothetical protein HKN36_00740 [Hellea sp.]|nr:hypothetical protein [Hellea sp.]